MHCSKDEPYIRSSPFGPKITAKLDTTSVPISFGFIECHIGKLIAFAKTIGIIWKINLSHTDGLFKMPSVVLKLCSSTAKRIFQPHSCHTQLQCQSKELNSSPPKRITMSASRTHFFKICDVSFSTLSPTSWPYLSLTCFEIVHITSKESSAFYVWACLRWFDWSGLAGLLR